MKTFIERFIEPENQTLLWETIQLCPVFKQLPQPETWFASIIEEVYEKAIEMDDTKENEEVDTAALLLELNEFAIYEMLTDFKVMVESKKKEKQVDINQQHRQEEMINWVVKDNQLRVDTTKDGPIKNMDDLLLEQQRLRDNDIPVLPKPMGEKASEA